MAFDLSLYEPVDERLHKWWKEFPDGRLETDIIDINANLSASSFEQINLPTQNELRFEDASGGQYVALKAAGGVYRGLTEDDWSFFKQPEWNQYTAKISFLNF